MLTGMTDFSLGAPTLTTRPDGTGGPEEDEFDDSGLGGHADDHAGDHGEDTDTDDDTDDGGRKDASGASRASRSRGAGGSRGQRNQVRRAAEKALALQSAPSADRALAAQIIGCDDDPVSMTVAVLTGGANVRAADDLFAIADAEDLLEAGAAATMLASDKQRLRALWSLLEVLGTVDGAAPAVAGKAGLAVARAVTGMDEAAKERLRAALALLA